MKSVTTGKAGQSRTLANLQMHKRVEYIDDERAVGNSIIITLKQGWTFGDGPDNRVTGANNVADAWRVVLAAEPYEGPYFP